jgi:hypothetical protein
MNPEEFHKHLEAGRVNLILTTESESGDRIVRRLTPDDFYSAPEWLLLQLQEAVEEM